jgi:hypothetical protein
MTQKGPPAIDFAYLEQYLGGDPVVTLEVLELFAQQAPGWRAGLDAEREDWRAVAHTVKGAARGVGANALGDAAHAAEFGEPADLAAVRAELATALAAIAAYRAERA